MVTNTADQATKILDDGKIAALVGGAHFFSHFFMVALPPLFPILAREQGLSFTALGGLLAIACIASGLLQIPMGVVVDRWGGRFILMAGIAVQASGILVIATASDYPMMVAGAVLLGIGNSVYHPADYAILSARIGAARIGRAFSAHTFSGYIGWAAAPLVMIPMAEHWSWRVALIAAGLAGLVMVAILLIARHLIATPRPVSTSSAQRDTGLQALMIRPILMCWVYFLLMSTMISGINGFGVTALEALEGLSIEAAGRAIAAFTLAAAIGVIAGGILADRTARHDLVAAAGMALAGTLILAIGISVPSPGVTFLLLVGAGFGVGIMLPSRDMIVRRSAPVGTVGQAFAVVTSGLELGGVLAPLAFGPILDHGAPSLLFVVGGIIGGTAATVIIVSRAKG